MPLLILEDFKQLRNNEIVQAQGHSVLGSNRVSTMVKTKATASAVPGFLYAERIPNSIIFELNLDEADSFIYIQLHSYGNHNIRFYSKDLNVSGNFHNVLNHNLSADMCLRINRTLGTLEPMYLTGDGFSTVVLNDTVKEAIHGNKIYIGIDLTNGNNLYGLIISEVTLSGEGMVPSQFSLVTKELPCEINTILDEDVEAGLYIKWPSNNFAPIIYDRYTENIFRFTDELVNSCYGSFSNGYSRPYTWVEATGTLTCSQNLGLNNIGDFNLRLPEQESLVRMKVSATKDTVLFNAISPKILFNLNGVGNFDYVIPLDREVEITVVKYRDENGTLISDIYFDGVKRETVGALYALHYSTRDTGDGTAVFKNIQMSREFTFSKPVLESSAKIRLPTVVGAKLHQVWGSDLSKIVDKRMVLLEDGTQVISQGTSPTLLERHPQSYWYVDGATTVANFTIVENENG